MDGGGCLSWWMGLELVDGASGWRCLFELVDGTGAGG